MNRFFGVFIVLILFASISASASFPVHGASPFVISQAIQMQSLRLFMEYLPDPSARLTHDDALARGGWMPLPRGDLGYLAYPVWTRVVLQNHGSEQKTLILRNPRAGTSQIDVSLITDGMAPASSSIGLVPSREDQLQWGRFPALSVTIPARGEVTVLSRVSSVGPMDVSWIASLPRDYSVWTAGDSWIRGVFSGVVLTMMVYSLFLWRGLRQPVLIAYAGFGALLFLVTLTYQGFYRLYNFGLPLSFSYYSTWITGGLLGTAMIAIAMYLFDTRVNLPRTHVWLRAILIAQLGIVSLVLIGIVMGKLNSVAPIIHVEMVATCIALLITGVLALHQRLPGAGYYLAGQGGLLVVIIFIRATAYKLALKQCS